ncbi:MAG: nitrate- and nitrite sensing domain-containing protein [Streptosporangiaceae bacterium]
MGLRLRSIRQRIFLLILVPVLSLIGLYAFATFLTARGALTLSQASTIKTATGQPTGAFLSQIDAERPLAIVYLSSPTGANLAMLQVQQNKTTAAAAALQTALDSAGTMNNATAPEKRAIATLLTDVKGLPALRAQVRSQIISKSRALGEYDAMVSDAYGVLDQAVLEQTNAPLVTQAQDFIRMGRAEDLMLQESAIISGDLAARSFPAADRQEFTQLVGARRALFSQTLPDLQPQYRAYYTRDINPQASSVLTGLENTLMSDARTSAPPPVQPQQWEAAVGGVAAGLSKAGTQASDAITAQASTNSDDTYLELVLAGGLGLLAVILSVIVSFVIGRGLIRELAALRESALELANVRLPDVVNRLAAGQDVDISAEAPDLPASSDEIGQVQQAFAAVQKTAVEAAVGQARLRQGISDIFRSLARRSQSLLHRQLALLDAMERRAREPEELEDLFRIDHLTTRMRRHAESLIILSGDAPARAWRRPVPFVDVLRAAVAEVEDYTRIKVTANTRAAINGPAVADVIHMIAELAENAVVFSPPNTPVLISGDVVGRGFAVEIEDRGLGLSEERRAELNELLKNPPPFDLSGSDQLGLFVASQLARKHNIQISLRSSPYGGTTAIVLIPNTLVVSEDSYQQDGTDADAGTGTGTGVQLTGRHAARDDTGSLGAVTGDTAGATGAAGTPVPSEVTASRPDDTAERWPADSGTDPWTAHAGADNWTASDPLAGWAGNGASATAEAANGRNGFHELPGYGDEGGWPAVSDPARVDTPSFADTPFADTPYAEPLSYADTASYAEPPSYAETPEHHDPDHDDGGFAEADSLPRRVRQASLAPQLRENTLYGRPSGNGEPGPSPGIEEERSPEEARNTITAIQRGWERGRSLFDPPEKTTGAMTGTQPAAEPSPPEAGEAGPQDDD